MGERRKSLRNDEVKGSRSQVRSGVTRVRRGERLLGSVGVRGHENHMESEIMKSQEA